MNYWYSAVPVDTATVTAIKIICDLVNRVDESHTLYTIQVVRSGCVRESGCGSGLVPVDTAHDNLGRSKASRG